MIGHQRLKLLTLPLCMLIAGCLSVIFGKDLCWDIANYHYYMPYHLFAHRESIDYWPASYIHQYLNPLIDFTTYFLITYTPAMWAMFIMGAIHGINAWLLFLIAYELIDKHRVEWAALIAIAGMLGPTVLPGIGSFQNDNLVSIFALSFVLFIIKFIKNNYAQKYFLITGSILLGLGFGLKLTLGVYIIGGAVSILFLPISFNQRFKLLIYFGLSTIFGFLITNGYWMMHLWQAHHNPLFPYFNQFFKSPDFPIMPFRDTRFLPQGILQTLFYPFYFSFDGRIADSPFRDFRFLVVYILLFALLIRHCEERFLRRSNPVFMPNTTRFLLIFFISSYIIWQYYFSTARYLAPIEMLAPLVIYLLISRKTIALILFILLTASMHMILMIRAPIYTNNYFNLKLPDTISNIQHAIVLVPFQAYIFSTDHTITNQPALTWRSPEPRPQSYLIPFFPSTWRFIGIPFWNGKANLSEQEITKIKSILKTDTAPIYLLGSDVSMIELNKSATQLGLKPTHRCEDITSDRQAETNQPTLLCALSQNK